MMTACVVSMILLGGYGCPARRATNNQLAIIAAIV